METEEDYVNFVRVVKKGSSGISLRELSEGTDSCVYWGCTRSVWSLMLMGVSCYRNGLRGRLLKVAWRL